MPTLKSSIPKYRKHKGSGQAVVTFNGRDHYLGPHGTKASNAEYDRLIAEWLASNRSPAFGRPGQVVTVTELVVAYLEHAKKYYGDGNRGEFANMRFALRPLRRLYGRQPSSEFGPLQLKAVRDQFIAAGNSRKYINGQVQRIVRVFRWGVSEGLLPPALPQALAMVPGLRMGHTDAKETERVRPADDQLVDAILSHLSPIVCDMVELHRLWGCRPGELVLVRPCDVDRSTDPWIYRPMKHKNQHREQDRTIYIGTKGQEILTRYLLRSPESYCFSPADTVKQQRETRTAARQTPNNQGNMVGSNRKRQPKRQAGAHYTPESYLYAVRRACDKAFPVPENIADDEAAVRTWRKKHRWSPNQLRHSMGTFVRKEFGIEAAKAVLGHSSTNTTGIYAEVDRQRAIEVARSIG